MINIDRCSPLSADSRSMSSAYHDKVINTNELTPDKARLSLKPFPTIVHEDLMSVGKISEVDSVTDSD